MAIKDKEGPRGSPSMKDILEIIQTIRGHMRLDAVVVQAQGTSTLPLDQGEYRINIYGNGFNPDGQGNIRAEPTLQNYRAYATYRGEIFQLAARIKVVLLKEIALIVPQDLPRGSGRGKVVGIFDDAVPGYLMLGYPEIHNLVL